jgi:protein O-mannosyl-transferase
MIPVATGTDYPAFHDARGQPVKKTRGRSTPRPRGPATARDSTRRLSFRWWVPLLVALVTAFAFLPSVHNGFTDWDDPFYVTDQPLIRDLSPHGIQALFTTFVEGNYHPLTMASFAVDYHFWKLDPRGYHIENIALHVLVTLLVFAFVLLLTRSRWMSAVTALFFGIHPLHVESVAWVSGRKDSLYALLYLASCISYVLWARGRKPGAIYYAAAILLFALSLLAKGMAVSLPLALLAIDFYFQRKPSVKTVLLEKAPFFLIALGFGYLAVVAQARQGAVQNLASFAFPERILFACYGISAYLIRAVAPLNLSALYPYPLRTAGGGLPLVYYLAPLGALAFAAGVLASLRSGRAVAFGALFFLANVAMVLQLLPVGSAVIADRYTYLSFVGIGFILASLAKPLAPRAAVAGFLAAAGILALLATQARCAVWKDNVTLWNDVLGRYPNLPLGYTMRARSYMQMGRNDLALADAEKAISLDPKQPRALTMRGTIRYLNRDQEGALADLEEAVRLEPREAVPWNSLGAVHLAQRRHDLALEDFTRAIERKSDYAEAYLNRALTLVGMNRLEQAIPDFDRSILLAPGNAKAYLWRGEARYLLGDKEAAILDYGRSLELDPGSSGAYYARSRARERLGRHGEALQDATRAGDLGYPVPPEYIDGLKKAIAGGR